MKIIFGLVVQKLDEKGMEISLGELLKNIPNTAELVDFTQDQVLMTDVPEGVLSEIETYCNRQSPVALNLPSPSTRSRVSPKEMRVGTSTLNSNASPFVPQLALQPKR